MEGKEPMIHHIQSILSTWGLKISFASPSGKRHVSPDKNCISTYDDEGCLSGVWQVEAVEQGPAADDAY